MELFQELGFLNREAWDFPAIVNLNVFRGACPCRCVHCPVGRTPASNRKTRFGKSELDLALYQKVVEEMSRKGGNRVLRIHSVGEPILWGALQEALRFSKTRNVSTWIFTSAMTTDYALLECLCRNADIIEVSVNSITREDYLATKGVDGFDTARSAILHMADYISRQGLGTRLLCSRVQSAREDDDAAFAPYWSAIPGVADAFVRSFHNYNGLLGAGESAPAEVQPCLVHWGRFNIDTDGTVAVCFNELFKKERPDNIILGNVREQSIEDIWKSEALNRIRRFQLGIGDAPAGKIPCAACTTRQKYPPHPFTSERQIAALKGGAC